MYQRQNKIKEEEQEYSGQAKRFNKKDRSFVNYKPRTNSGVPEKPDYDTNSLTLNDRSLKDLK